MKVVIGMFLMFTACVGAGLIINLLCICFIILIKFIVNKSDYLITELWKTFLNCLKVLTVSFVILILLIYLAGCTSKVLIVERTQTLQVIRKKYDIVSERRIKKYGLNLIRIRYHENKRRDTE